MLGEIFSPVLNTILGFLSFSWWFWVAIIMFPLFLSVLVAWRQEVYEHDLKWLLFEIRMPRENTRSPKAMEQVLTAIHALGNYAQDLQEVYYDGEVTRWFSFEMVSFSGEIHFYIRTYHKFRSLIEAAFFSFYPDVELVEVEDYVTQLPDNVKELKDKGYDLWATEMKLSKDDAYPIKTYVSFESMDEDKQFDPISQFVEVLGKVKPGEFVGIQIIAAPSRGDWRKHGEKIVKKLKESAVQRSQLETPEGQMETVARFLTRSPGETDVLKALEANLSKQAFETVIRYIYTGPKTTFYESFARRGIAGLFRQYDALDLNTLVRNEKVSTRVKIWYFPYVFPGTRNIYRQARLLHNYRIREFRKETFMGKFFTSYIFNWNFASKAFHMTTEELATLFHPPTAVVLTAPHMKRIESRKAGPPAGMAIFGDERDIEKYN